MIFRPNRIQHRRGRVVGSLLFVLVSAFTSVSADNGDVQRVSDVLQSKTPTDLAFSDSSLWVATRNDGKLHRVDLSLQSVQTTIDNPHGVGSIPNLVLTWGIASRPSGALFVLAQDGAVWAVREVTTAGTEVGSFNLVPPDSDANRFRGLTFDPTNNHLWSLETNRDEIVRFNLSGSAVESLALPGGNAVLRGEGVAIFETGAGHRLYAAHGDIFRSGPTSLLQLTMAGEVTGFVVPLLEVPGIVSYGFEMYQAGAQTRAVVINGDGQLIEIEHSIPSIAPPSQLACTLTAANNIVLTWTNHGSGAGGNYSQSLTVARDGAPIATVSGTTTSFVDTTPQEGPASYTVGVAESSASSLPCTATVGTGGLIAWTSFGGVKPYDITRNPVTGELLITDDPGVLGDGRIFRYNSDLELLGEIPSPFTDPGAITYVESIDVPTFQVDPPFVTLEDVIAVGRQSTPQVSLIEPDGNVLTTLTLEIPGSPSRVGGLTYIAAEQKFICIEMESREIMTFSGSGQLLDTCFPKGTLPPLPLEETLELGVTYDHNQATLLAGFDDGEVRELFPDADAQGGCVATTFSFSLSSLGDQFNTNDFFSGFEIVDNTLVIGGRDSNAIFQVLMHPFTNAFRRGDADRDGSIDLNDAVRVANYLFKDGALTITCLDAADVNDDGILDVSDPIYLLFHLFRQGPAPPAPYNAEGSDPTFRDNLGCAS